MSSIPNINSHAAYPIDRPAVIGRIGSLPAVQQAAAEGSSDKADRVELSTEALEAAQNADAARAARLARIKSQIQAGTYDEETKLVFAADKIARALRNG